jgi:hypothetical protein
MNRFFLVMLVLIFCTPVVCELWGQAPDLPSPPDIPAIIGGPVAPEAVQSDSRQTASVEEATTASVVRVRDPFWPVGYTPKVIRKSGELKAGGASTQGAVAELPEHARAPQWDEARRRLDVRGISLIGRDKANGQPKFLAMVAGKLVEEGNVVNVIYEDRVYRWKIVGIGKGGISFQKLDVRQE